MSSPTVKNEEKRLTWNNIFPAVTARRYSLVTNTDTLIDGIKKLCESGNPDVSYFILETVLGRQFPILLCHPAVIPEKCMVIKAQAVLGYEDDSSYIMAFKVNSVLTGQKEFTCVIINDLSKKMHARLCTLAEMNMVFNAFNEYEENELVQL